MFDGKQDWMEGICGGNPCICTRQQISLIVFANIFAIIFDPIIVFFTQKFILEKINNLVYNKDLLAIIFVFEEWAPYLGQVKNVIFV